MRKIKIAQIGIGPHTHSSQTLRSMQKQSDIFEIVGFAVPENMLEVYPKRRDHFGDIPEMTVDEIMNNPEIEAVAIETDEMHMTKYALMAAEHNKHIHMDKPGGTELFDFEKLIETVKKNKLTFHTGYMYRYNPYVKDILKRVRRGELGEIYSVEAQMNCRHTIENRQWLECLPGGMMFYLGCHLVDLILLIQGVPENIISLNRPTGIDNVTSDDFGMAVFEYKNGVSFAKTCAEEMGGYARRQLVVCGEKGTIELKPLEVGVKSDTVYTGKTEYFAPEWGNAGIKSKTDDFNRYDEMMMDFAKIVRGEKENEYTYDYELQLYKCVLKACGKEVAYK